MSNMTIAVVNAGVSDPSSTQLLAERIAQGALLRCLIAGHAKAGTRARVLVRWRV